MSGSFKRVMECVCAHYTSSYTHPKEFLGKGVRTRLNFQGKIPSTGGTEEG